MSLEKTLVVEFKSDWNYEKQRFCRIGDKDFLLDHNIYRKTVTQSLEELTSEERLTLINMNNILRSFGDKIQNL